MGTNSSDRIRELRERRIRLAEERESRRKRSDVGSAVVEKINAALGSHLVLDDFDVGGTLPVRFDREPDFRDCGGLVAAHMSEEAVRSIASCCDSISGPLTGIVGFDEYAYVGTARVEAVTMTSLLRSCATAPRFDSVLSGRLWLCCVAGSLSGQRHPGR